MDPAAPDPAQPAGQDPAGYQDFFAAHRDYVLTYVRHRRAAYNVDIDALVDIGDVVQETMLAAYVDWTTVRSITQPRPWLRRVANNKLVDQIRRSITRDSGRIPLDESLWGRMSGPPGGLDMVLAHEAITEAFALLTLAQREVLTRAMSGLSVAEIAEKTGLSADAVYKHRARARQVIRELHERCGEPPAPTAPRSAVPASDDRAPILSLQNPRARAAASRLTAEQLARRYPALARTLQARPRPDTDLVRAIALYENALASREKAYGPDHQASRSVRADLARALRTAGEHDRAAPLLERVLLDMEHLPGNHTREITTIRAELADALRAIGQLDRAAELYEQVLAVQKRSLGTLHPRILATRARLARTYHATGELARAIEYFQQVLTGCEQTLGTGHSRTKAVRADLAEALRAAGRHQEAIPVLTQVLTDQDSELGPDHPRTLTTHTRLARTYHAAGDPARAITHFEQALSSYERVLGAIHSDTVTVRADLAAALHSDKQYTRAIPVLTAVLDENDRFLGPEHPHARATRTRLAEAYESTRQLDPALRLYQQNHDIHQQALGRYHRDTMRCRIPIVRVLRVAGDLERAVIEQHLIVTDRTHVYGENDTATAKAKKILADLLMARHSRTHKALWSSSGHCPECIGSSCCGGPPPTAH